ncbi:hypothetical protein N7471_013410 [Penicillium samsonianum]|uniref:uncharacterized protein n=1 Tax=Penicillium samsonianum TaxID=1882272 RepID=UPI0025495717|nr:uncharacterized protein N7471_013410 [Penicillium samsonianum]KAJ6118790.1 hypothetical protein N7471_013410 [Penicillium samsonianum]
MQFVQYHKPCAQKYQSYRAAIAQLLKQLEQIRDQDLTSELKANLNSLGVQSSLLVLSNRDEYREPTPNISSNGARLGDQAQQLVSNMEVPSSQPTPAQSAPQGLPYLPRHTPQDYAGDNAAAWHRRADQPEPSQIGLSLNQGQDAMIPQSYPQQTANPAEGPNQLPPATMDRYYVPNVSAPPYQQSVFPSTNSVRHSPNRSSDVEPGNGSWMTEDFDWFE